VNKKKITLSKEGFTLIELLVVTAIVGVVLTAVYSLFTKSNEIYTSQEQIVKLEQDIRATLGMIVKNVRMAGLDPERSGCAGFFEPTNGTSVSLRMDYDGDGSCTDSSPEQELTYKYAANNNEILNKGNDRIAKDIVSFDLCYWLEGGTSCIADPDSTEFDEIRMVDIEICGKISGPYAQKYDQEYCMTSSAKCRNLGL
jgi:type IV pilus assembly protein PilW